MAKEKSQKDSSLLKYITDLDKSLSSALSLSATKSSPLGHYRAHMKALEYSCHSAFWILGPVIMLWFTEDHKKKAFLFNLLLAVWLDTLLVALLKVVIGRKGPPNNDDDMKMTWSLDKMSCPSGHTSRAVLLTFIRITSPPQMYLLHPFLLVWCFCISASRILLGRNYIGDVLIGMVLGYIEYCIVDYICAGLVTAKWYLDV